MAENKFTCCLFFNHKQLAAVLNLNGDISVFLYLGHPFTKVHSAKLFI